MIRRLVLAAVLSAGALALPAAASAAQPQSVTIVSNMTMADPFNYGDFHATGSDLICASGTVNDTRIVWGAPRSEHARVPQGIQLLVDKTFTCDDASGQIFFRIQVNGAYSTETFNWVILGGTKAYAGLHGQGSGVTGWDNWPVVTNHYEGSLVD